MCNREVRVITDAMHVYTEWLGCRMDHTPTSELHGCMMSHRRLYRWIKQCPFDRTKLLLRLLNGTLATDKAMPFLSDRTLLEVVHMRTWAMYELAMTAYSPDNQYS